eukprot:g74932.t1
MSKTRMRREPENNGFGWPHLLGAPALSCGAFSAVCRKKLVRPDRLLLRHAADLPSIPSQRESDRLSSRNLSLLLGSAVFLLGCGWFSSGFTGSPLEANDVVKNNYFDEFGRFLMSDFDARSPYSSFLPGIAGRWGKPMWSFYINRGQAIASFGRMGKDAPLLEFQAANKAYQDSTVTGFRTFIKASADNWGIYQPLSPSGVYQPLLPDHLKKGLREKDHERNMKVGMNEMEVEEINRDNGLITAVRYFTLTDEDFGGLVRQLMITNNSTQSHSLEILDGLCWMQPAGVNDWGLKNIGRTLEGFEVVYNLEGGSELPFYHLKDSFVDSAIVTPVLDGNYLIAYIEGPQGIQRLKILADALRIFGQDTSLTHPTAFAENNDFDSLTANQVVVGRTPAAFATAKVTLAPGEKVTINSIYGHAADFGTLKNKIEPKVTAPGFVESKRQAAVKIIEDITQAVNTQSADKMFDGSLKQVLLDNYLRGGAPQLLGDPNDPAIYHIYSRRHGDLERDYNNFVIEPQFFSTGPGNFRDVAQNRRCDVFLEPKVGDFNFRNFLEMVQSDGYNPLEVRGNPFILNQNQTEDIAKKCTADEKSRMGLIGIIANPEGVYLGNMFVQMEQKKVELTANCSRDDLVTSIALLAKQEPDAGGGDQYWSDHWTYTLDLLDTYLTVFPDKLQAVLYDAPPLGFFNNMVFVQPRSWRHVLVSGIPQQRNFTEWLKPWVVARSNMWKKDGSGQVFKLPVISKLFILTVIKFSTIDSMGMGVEMEGGKPGWLDSQNGMPGWFGSGMPETYEVLRHLRYLIQVNNKVKKDIIIHAEFADFLQAISSSLDQFDLSKDTFAFWNQVTTARELYRDATKWKFKGTTVTLSTGQVDTLLTRMAAKTQVGITRAFEYTKPVSASYFMFNATRWTEDRKIGDTTFVTVQGFKVMALPLFLEGPTRHMKLLDQDQARALFQAVKASSLYDSKLKMYKISENLDQATDQMGRTKAFAPGWLENESIWLHMAYKFYLQLLRAGLFNEFWAEFKTGCTAFMDPAIYGRNPQECSSFIVSSAHPDKNLHGQGFLARLSGSTAEMLSMYFLMMAGPRPFGQDEQGQLYMELKPALPSWLFTEQGTLTFRYLGAVDITYHQEGGFNSWDTVVASTEVTFSDGPKQTYGGPKLPAEVATKVRSGGVSKMTVELVPGSGATKQVAEL